MVYTLGKYEDGTTATFSDIKTKEDGKKYIIVSFERLTDKGFDSVAFEIPGYEIVEKSGNYSEEEIKEFRTVVEQSSKYIFEWSKKGGFRTP